MKWEKFVGPRKVDLMGVAAPLVTELWSYILLSSELDSL